MAKIKFYTQKQFIKKFNELIETKIKKNSSILDDSKKDIRIKDLAAEFNINVATLRRWSIDYTQFTPKQYLDNYRIKKAKELRKRGFKSKDIAVQLGYTEQKVFCSVYKRYNPN